MPGPANTLTIGTVTTLEAGASATAEITGDAPEQVLNLGIPQGKDGADGASEITISSDGKTYSPDEQGVITLGGAAGRDVTHDTDSLTEMKAAIPGWVPSGSHWNLTRGSTDASVIDWSRFTFAAGCSYAISKDSKNDPLAGKGENVNAAWAVTCLSNSYESPVMPGSFLIVRESWATQNSVFLLYRYYDKSAVASAHWMIGVIPMVSSTDL
ncbi:hypothetical protein OQO23_004451 [Salmonella enterica]|nr:hypothetical protein [Salmonella enterica]